MSRQVKISRQTKETKISLQLNLDGKGKSKIMTGIGFLDHMLTSFALHASFDLTISAKGDLQVDQHHLLEDLGIALGQAFDQALGQRRGILRAGFWHGAFLFPMDETAALTAIDFGGRTKLVWRVKLQKTKVGDLVTENIEDFFEGFVNGAKANVLVETHLARSEHHRVEAIFKSFARALRMAVSLDSKNPNRVPSAKGKI